ncbi:uncharacterized protein EV420DRAFT_1579258 [Desarmillaria tabescens]|uniref:C2H2-type domain-containing protein n=1 Tax=Armillaria tabescens TaxID=1929756 RepID=A0AA39MQG6_ARMTA|nr:uncharacterized protein EV420DRAFT_1579258 [Desarmillaria tabescens]KAK0442040.1 hypothetical protein EV420DRAFT_1579258 [Desarmillaria tabescens]
MPRVSSNKSNKRVQCKVCFKEYADATGLSRHSKIHRPNAENLKLRCPVCPYRAWQKGGMKDHIRAQHTGEKPFTCPAPDCTYAASSPACLYRHKKKCEKLNAPPEFMQQPLPPKQLLPAVDAGMPLEEVTTSMTFPQSNVESWSSEDLVPSSTLSQSDVDGILSSFTISSSHANHSPSPEMVTSTSATHDSLFMNTNGGGFTDPFFLDTTFSVASPTWSDFGSPVSSTSSATDERLSPPFGFDFDQSLISSFSWDNSMSTSSSPLNFDVTETHFSPDSPFSSTSPKNERLSPALSFDSSMEDFSFFPYEQLSTPPFFQAEQSSSPSPSAFDLMF